MLSKVLLVFLQTLILVFVIIGLVNYDASSVIREALIFYFTVLASYKGLVGIFFIIQ